MKLWLAALAVSSISLVNCNAEPIRLGFRGSADVHAGPVLLHEVADLSQVEPALMKRIADIPVALVRNPLAGHTVMLPTASVIRELRRSIPALTDHLSADKQETVALHVAKSDLSLPPNSSGGLPCWIVASPISAGSPVGVDEVSFKRECPVSVGHPPPLLFDKTNSLVLARRDIAQGEAIPPVSAQSLVKVRSGDDVEITVKVGAVRLVSKGAAVRHAHASESVFVRTKSGAIVAATTGHSYENQSSQAVELCHPCLGNATGTVR